VTAPPSKPIWQRVISHGEGDSLRANTVSPYFGGLPDVVNGFVTLAMHTIRLTGSRAVYDALRLDYPGSHFHPDEPLYAIRFTADSVAGVHVTDKPLARSVGKEGGVDLGYGPPYLGNGFTGGSEYNLPEYWMVDGVIDPGAELWLIPPIGEEQLAAIMTGNKEWVGVSGFGD
jgi:hypothetical protein